MIAWRQILHAALMVPLLLPAACSPGWRPISQDREIPRGSAMAEMVFNGRLFGDQQNSSSLPVTGTIAGSEVWFAASPDPQRRRPFALGIAGDRVVVTYGNLLAVLNRRDGSLLWSRSIRGNHLFEVSAAGILTLDQAAYHVLLDSAGRPGEQLYLASVHERAVLHFATTLADGSWAYCVEQMPEPMSSPDETPEEPATRFVRYDPKNMDVRFEYVMPPDPRGFAATKDLAYLFAAYAGRLYSFPIEAMSNDEVRSAEFSNVISLSTDGQGNALLVDIVEDSTEIKQVKPDGTVGWVVSFDKTDVSPQPPASTPDGYVYLVIDSTLHQMRNGELLWSHRLKAKTQDIAITILADNSVLAAAGQALVHLSATGEELLTKWLDAAIVTRPIMDEDGKVYYGGVDGIHCMR